MNQKYRNYIMWALYALLFLFTLLVQSLVFGRTRFFGVKLSLIPVCVACVAMLVGHEAGGLFALLAGLFWCWSGADGGALCLFTLTVIGIAAGYLCDNVFTPSLLPALGLSFLALLLHEGVLFLSKYSLHGASLSMAQSLPLQAGLSLLACPVLYLLAKAIRKAGAV